LITATTWDGRGITIGIVDTGGLPRPSEPTRHGHGIRERKVIEWVTGTDP
jgi:hypothetical protein